MLLILKMKPTLTLLLNPSSRENGELFMQFADKLAHLLKIKDLHCVITDGPIPAALHPRQSPLGPHCFALALLAEPEEEKPTT